MVDREFDRVVLMGEVAHCLCHVVSETPRLLVICNITPARSKQACGYLFHFIKRSVSV